jgi:hypothetical protein
MFYHGLDQYIRRVSGNKNFVPVEPEWSVGSLQRLPRYNFRLFCFASNFLGILSGKMIAIEADGLGSFSRFQPV